MDYKRPDGRLVNELRDVNITFDGLCSVDGSARFGFGNTKALASLSGPMEVRLAAEQASRATFEVIFRPLSGIPGAESKALASALRTALLPSIVLTTNPRTLVQLVVQSLVPTSMHAYPKPTTQKTSQASSSSLMRLGPSTIAATINASTLALLNASSVPLRGVVCAAAVGRTLSAEGGDRMLLVDPSREELASLDGAGVFAFLVTGGQPSSISSLAEELDDDDDDNEEGGRKAELVWSSWTALPFDEEEAERALALARIAALRVRVHMKQAVAQVVHGENVFRKDEKGKGVDRGLVDVDDDKMEIS